MSTDERRQRPGKTSTLKQVCPEVFARCIDVIQPARDARADCEAALKVHLDLISVVRERPERLKIFYSGEWKRALAEFASTLARAASLMQDLPIYLAIAPAPAPGKTHQDEWADVIVYLERVASEAKRFCEGIKPGPPPAFAKFMCALSAFEILERFGGKPPTLTANGTFYRLATVLFEAVSGQSDASLERQCRTVFRSTSQHATSPLVRLTQYQV